MLDPMWMDLLTCFWQFCQHVVGNRLFVNVNSVRNVRDETVRYMLLMVSGCKPLIWSIWSLCLTCWWIIWPNFVGLMPMVGHFFQLTGSQNDPICVDKPVKRSKFYCVAVVMFLHLRLWLWSRLNLALYEIFYYIHYLWHENVIFV